MFEQNEEVDEHNVQLSPPGFHVIFLPFTDDIRKLVYQQTPKGNNKNDDNANNINNNIT